MLFSLSLCARDALSRLRAGLVAVEIVAMWACSFRRAWARQQCVGGNDERGVRQARSSVDPGRL